MAATSPNYEATAASSPDVPTNIKSIQTNSATKAQEEFRTYDDETSPRVLEHYRDMRMYQTVEFYDRMAKKYSFENGNYRLVCWQVRAGICLR